MSRIVDNFNALLPSCGLNNARAQIIFCRCCDPCNVVGKNMNAIARVRSFDVFTQSLCVCVLVMFAVRCTQFGFYDVRNHHNHEHEFMIYIIAAFRMPNVGRNVLMVFMICELFQLLAGLAGFGVIGVELIFILYGNMR